MDDSKNNPDRLAERLQAQARVLEQIAGECWNEKTASNVRKLAQEATQAQWPPLPTLWNE